MSEILQITANSKKGPEIKFFKEFIDMVINRASIFYFISTHLLTHAVIASIFYFHQAITTNSVLLR